MWACDLRRDVVSPDASPQCRRARVSNLTRQRESVCLIFSGQSARCMFLTICGDAVLDSSSLLSTSTHAFSRIRCLSQCATASRSYHRGRITAQHPLWLFHGRCWRYWLSPRWQQCQGCQSCPSRDARFPARFRAFESRVAFFRINLH